MLILQRRMVFLLHREMLSLLVCDFYLFQYGQFLSFDFLFSVFNFDKRSIWQLLRRRHALVGQNRLVILLISQRQSTLVDLSCHLLLDRFDDAIIDNIFGLIWSDLMQLLPIYFVLSHHLILMLHISFELLQNAPILLGFQWRNL